VQPAANTPLLRDMGLPKDITPGDTMKQLNHRSPPSIGQSPMR
jgi:hypothetical protein